MQYGWAGSGPNELDSEQAEVFQEAYAADPTWAAKGPALLQPPRLAGGRLVVELTSQKEAPKASCKLPTEFNSWACSYCCQCNALPSPRQSNSVLLWSGCTHPHPASGLRESFCCSSSAGM